ncbi:MAG: outer membrane lipoprotein-sorting protein [Acidobacteriota bacterium]
MKKSAKFCLFLMLTALFVYGEDKSPTGKDIMKKVFSRKESRVSRMEIDMILINKRNRERKRSMLIMSKYFGNDKKSIFLFRSPSSVKGVKFLSHDYENPKKEDERWLFFPSLKRVKRIIGSSKNDYFMGSDLTYNDLRKRDENEETHKLISEKESDGISYWIVESTPKSSMDLYSRQVSRIRKDALVPVEVDFFDKRGKLIKIMRVKELEKIEDYWVVKRLEVENVQKKHKTVLVIKKIEFNINIKDNIFLPSRLDSVRIN